MSILLSHEQKLVVKPDELIKRRGKLGLIKVNIDYTEVKKWILERTGKDTQVGSHDSCLHFFSCLHLCHEIRNKMKLLIPDISKLYYFSSSIPSLFVTSASRVLFVTQF